MREYHDAMSVDLREMRELLRGDQVSFLVAYLGV